MRDQKKKKKGDGEPSFGKMNWDKYSHYAVQDFFIFLICVICFVEEKKKVTQNLKDLTKVLGKNTTEFFDWEIKLLVYSSFIDNFFPFKK